MTIARRIAPTGSLTSSFGNIANGIVPTVTTVVKGAGVADESEMAILAVTAVAGSPALRNAVIVTSLPLTTTDTAAGKELDAL